MAWMRPTLAYLFEACEDEELRNAVRDKASLTQLRIELTGALSPSDQLSLPVGERGDNLILGLIALRLKFPRKEAEHKLERNLQLRTEEDRRQGGK